MTSAALSDSNTDWVQLTPEMVSSSSNSVGGDWQSFASAVDDEDDTLWDLGNKQESDLLQTEEDVDLSMD